MMRVLVIGGGIAGLAAARAIAARGMTVELVEREPIWRTSGAAITLYPNAERALGRLGLDGAIVAASAPISTIRVLSASGAHVAEVAAETWPGVGRTMAIHRGVLHDILVDGARDAELRLGVTFESIENDDERVGVSFSDGGSCDYDVVLGADGARSAVRTAVCGDTILRPLDQMYWRVAINAPIVDQATMVFDDQRYVALMPLGGERTYLALQRRQSPVVVPADMRVASLRAGCEGLGGPVPYALDAVVADEDVFVGPAEEQVADRWDAGRIVLIGDAAHTLSPVLAQGGALALEDAVVLGEELGTSTDIDGALRAFLARRVPRVAALRDHTTRRIAMLNAGADQVDLAEATAALNTLLQQSI